jgi:SAM-dependent methyltransferase
VIVGWDNEETARYYEAFCEAHGRYREANAALVQHACLCRHQCILDVAAGTGRTAEAVLPYLGTGGRITCWEPSAAMRAAGVSRLHDPRIAWTDVWPRKHARFDRILCGAAIWQLAPIEDAIRRMASLLGPGGMLCFNVPSLYLGEPDEPGGGDDSSLLRLIGVLASGRVPSAAAAVPLSRNVIESALAAARLSWKCWQFRYRFSQAAFRDWLKIPVLTDALLPDLDAGERSRRIDAAFEHVDGSSWRWESWTGWTAGKVARFSSTTGRRRFPCAAASRLRRRCIRETD